MLEFTKDYQSANVMYRINFIVYFDAAIGKSVCTKVSTLIVVIQF